MEKINTFLENRIVFKVLGPECIEFLNNILTTDLKKLELNVIAPCALLSPQGRILFDMLISVNASNDHNNYPTINIECDKNQINDLIKKINMYNLRKEVEIQSTDYKVFVSNENIETSNTFTDKRFLNKEIRRIYCKDNSILKTIYNRDFYDFLRFKNCILEGPSEIEPNMTLPSEINLDLLGGISFDKGCFIGQEVNARIKWKGLVKKKYVPIKFKNTDLSLLKFDKTKDRRILLNDIEIGEIVSITENTNDNYHYGIAKIKLSQLYLFENDNNLKCDFSHYKVSVIFPKYMLPLPKKI
jgi:folate-binding protein YgfZ